MDQSEQYKYSTTGINLGTVPILQVLFRYWLESDTGESIRITQQVGHVELVSVFT